MNTRNLKNYPVLIKNSIDLPFYIWVAYHLTKDKRDVEGQRILKNFRHTLIFYIHFNIRKFIKTKIIYNICLFHYIFLSLCWVLFTVNAPIFCLKDYYYSLKEQEIIISWCENNKASCIMFSDAIVFNSIF